MPNIGDRLEEARKRQGISIREASEATKIRSDFLTCFENNQFDFNLPEVYRRGFLKIYSRYLKLDVEKVLNDYQAILLGASRSAKRDNREFFGRMDLPEDGTSEEVSEPAADSGLETIAHKTMGESFDGPAQQLEHKTDTSLYWKIGLVVAGTFVLIALLVLLVKALISPTPVVVEPGPVTT
ncbi:MAG: helix-turn-helix domain-containing protein, partial [Verrucomicrobiota bacterium]